MTRARQSKQLRAPRVRRVGGCIERIRKETFDVRNLTVATFESYSPSPPRTAAEDSVDMLRVRYARNRSQVDERRRPYFRSNVSGTDHRGELGKTTGAVLSEQRDHPVAEV